jgi:hypothetical protein
LIDYVTVSLPVSLVDCVTMSLRSKSSIFIRSSACSFVSLYIPFLTPDVFVSFVTLVISVYFFKYPFISAKYYPLSIKFYSLFELSESLAGCTILREPSAFIVIVAYLFFDSTIYYWYKKIQIPIFKSACWLESLLLLAGVLMN